MRRIGPYAATLFLLATLTGCGGGGGGSSTTTANTAVPTTVAAANNVTTITVAGAQNSVNIPTISITLCTPGASVGGGGCQTINNILVDTGSVGLRVFASVITPSILSGLTPRLVGSSPLYECTQFADGYTWGTVRSTDLHISGETALSLPIQVIADSSETPAVTTAPTGCSNVGASLNSVASFGVNGVLGIGSLSADCGSACASISPSAGYYYTCSSSGSCTPATVPINPVGSAAYQVQNPISQFSADNNGSLIILPAVGSTGVVSATGSLIFGINTQSNNTLSSSVSIVPLDISAAFKTTLSGASSPYGYSFLDTGSNAYFFNVPYSIYGSAPAQLISCNYYTTSFGFYCPTSEVTLIATAAPTTGVGRGSGSITFAIKNANTLFATSNTVFNNLGGPGMAGGNFIGSFDWGLPFYLGRTVYTSISGQSVSGYSGATPFVAF